ncbi:unnamed protein product [Cuscuta epithymum]|uniref:Bifunctional inhibitor/plant lipid transfer protein/seed storage helical domain-containing protein n=1 Tax=Cuscuta epithymum TaxID=186058 RepID=A0AAV0CNY2_9ASTE|nr:unnamed protein product [Cuscuta epithymum]CAH9130655.1 unnamed protein product [Cuscuta epithymum]
MAMRLNAIGHPVLVFLAIWALTAVSARHHAPAPAADCNSVILNLEDCLTFVTNGSVLKKPEGNCCPGLKKVLKTNAECLCEGFEKSAQLGVVLNLTQAMSLPAVCRVSSHSATTCALTSGSTPSPAPSPSALPQSSTAAAPTDAVGGITSVTSPTTSPGSSASSSLALFMPIGSFSFTLLTLFLSF